MRIVLHAGLKKTGSTAIQIALARDAARLSRLGVFVPEADMGLAPGSPARTSGNAYGLALLAEEAGVETFVYFSSSEAYQTPTVIPTPEDVPLVVPDVHNPRYSYGGGKILAEMLLLHYARPAGMRRLVIRPHNVYGPAMGFEHVIPQLVERVYRASDGLRLPEASIVLQGTGRETRAFCHVDDAVAGTLLAFEKGADGTVYHLGNPVETTILELLRRIGERCGVRVRPETGEAPAGATPRRCPDVGRLAKLGYVPRVDLATGLAGTVDWYAAYFRDRAGLPGGRDDKGAH